jgi:hypothetical protein
VLNYKLDDYSYLDTTKLASDIHKYISYFNSKNNEFYPSSKMHVKSISYSMYQLNKWIELTCDNLEINDINDLEIANEKDAMYYADKLSVKDYIEKGPIIGNLSESGKFCTKFQEILKISVGKRAVFYSSFTKSGIILFKQFLKTNNVKYLYLDINTKDSDKTIILDTFKNTTVFLLLHPAYTEGITIYGAEQIHILEPIANLSKKEQLIARVIRYKSHDHLPPNERHVDIFQWACEINSILDTLKTKYVSFTKWIKFHPEVSFLTNISSHDQHITPDSLILKKESNIKSIKEELSHKIRKLSKHIDIKCCVKLPFSEQENICTKKIGKC